MLQTLKPRRRLTRVWVVAVAILSLAACAHGGTPIGHDAWIAFGTPADPNPVILAPDGPPDVRVERVSTSRTELAVGDTADVHVWVAHGHDESVSFGISPAFSDPDITGQDQISPSDRRVRLEATDWEPAVVVPPNDPVSITFALRATEAGRASFGIILSANGKPTVILPVFEVMVSDAE